MLQVYKEIMGDQLNEIMEYCLGKKWVTMPISQSRKLFNEKLNLVIESNEDPRKCARMIKDAYNALKSFSADADADAIIKSPCGEFYLIDIETPKSLQSTTSPKLKIFNSNKKKLNKKLLLVI